MQRFELNRRQFMQVGVAAALTAHGHIQGKSIDAGLTQPMTTWDPHLTLALANRFADHDLEAWGRSTRMCGTLPVGQLAQLRTLLGEQGNIQSMFSTGDDAWVTLSLQVPALLRMLQQGTHLFKDHLWGAPWFHPTRMANPSGQRPGPVVLAPSLERADLVPSRAGADCRQRVLLIDHGFPMEHLRHQGLPHHHRVSPWAGRGRSAERVALSHGAQVAGLLLQGLHPGGPWPDLPLLLYELPDEILTSMPYAALWPEVVDAIIWALSLTPRGGETIVLLSLVSTDADRHPRSFMSRCAGALSAHARSLGVRLTWVMAAGNSHADRQNLALVAHAQTPVDVQWRLPAQNFRPSFLECWHDASMGPPSIQVRPPGGDWSDSMTTLSMASRVHDVYGRRQTVLRLPPTAAWMATPALAQSGDWGVRWVFEKSGRLDLHLSMMTGLSQGLLRQAQITAPSTPPEAVAAPNSISGLIPSLPNVVVAQTLSPSVADPRLVAPDHQSLSAYCGRWSQPSDGGDTRAIGFKVGGSHVNRGVLTWSRQGHRIHRATGTSMAVPLAARWLMGVD